MRRVVIISFITWTVFHLTGCASGSEAHSPSAAGLSILLIVVLALLLIAAVILNGILYHRYRQMRQNNQSLMRQLEEATAYKEKYPALNPVEEKSAEPAPNLDAMDASALFQYLSRIILDEQLFLDPAFDRQSIIDRFHLSKERIGNAFAQGSDYASLSTFVTHCRLEYATHLLLEQPKLRLNEVATASGFSTVNYFGRAFRATYGLSATDFRKQQETRMPV